MCCFTSGQDVFSGVTLVLYMVDFFVLQLLWISVCMLTSCSNRRKLKRKVVKKLEWEMRDYISTLDTVLLLYFAAHLFSATQNKNLNLAQCVTSNVIYSGTYVFILPVLGL